MSNKKTDMDKFLAELHELHFVHSIPRDDEFIKLERKYDKVKQLELNRFKNKISKCKKSI